MKHLAGHFTKDNHIHNSRSISSVSIHLQQRYHNWGPSEKMSSYCQSSYGWTNNLFKYCIDTGFSLQH